MLLDLRLNILDKYVDKFVITESAYMHSGKPKKLNFNINNFIKFKDKIIYNVVDKEPSNLEVINQNDNKDIRGSKLICFATGSIGDIPGRFETLEASRDRLKKEGIKQTVLRVPKKWFVEGDRAKYFYFCENATKETTEETADNALLAMKNWRGFENLKNINNDTLIIWGDKDVSYNFEQVDTLNKNIPNSELVIFKGCCHNVHLEKPDEFNKTLHNYLNK